ncbi:MAG: STAS domain-containing protein [Acidobacteriia bacterium]|nr:STAS domain-containing protein [Terriglobia bacterium]
MHTRGPVVVMELPEQLNHPEVMTFLDEITPLLESDRPRVVLDCSQVRYIDSAGIEMLLRCMEEAMKRDGDLKLAAVSPESAVILELMRVDRLFETFETSEAAVQSFHGLPARENSQSEPWNTGAYGALGDLEAAG